MPSTLDRCYKTFQVQELKADVAERTVTGYAATWELDQVKDRIEKGAFKKTVKERGPDGTGQIKVLWQHRDPIGLPLEMHEDDIGLWVKMKISDTMLGNEALQLLRDGVVDRMSIGFDIVRHELVEADADAEKCFACPDTRVRVLKEIRLYEVSFVTFPANEAARVLAVKDLSEEQLALLADLVTERLEKGESWKVGGSRTLSLADRDREWDAGAAKRRMLTAAGGKEDFRSATYRRGFVAYNSANPDLLGSYKLPFADVIEGKLTAVPRGVFAAAAALQGSRGGVDLPEATVASSRNLLSAYYRKLDLDPPWGNKEGILDKEEKGELNALMREALEAFANGTRALEALLEVTRESTPSAPTEVVPQTPISVASDVEPPEAEAAPEDIQPVLDTIAALQLEL